MIRSVFLPLLCILSVFLFTACDGEQVESVDYNELESFSYEKEKNAEINENKLVEKYSFDGKELDTPDYSILITDYKVIQPGEDNNYGDEPVIMFFYDTTVKEKATNQNITPSTAWIITFEVIQDNDPNFINNLDLGTVYDEEKSGDKKIKPGGTVSSSISYNLTDSETPVTLIAAKDIVNRNEIGRHDYQVE